MSAFYQTEEGIVLFSDNIFKQLKINVFTCLKFILRTLDNLYSILLLKFIEIIENIK